MAKLSADLHTRIKKRIANESSPSTRKACKSFLALEAESVRSGRCTQCSGSVLAFTHTLMIGQLLALIKLHKRFGHGHEFRLLDVTKGISSVTNFQKLRYLGLVQKRIERSDGSIKWSSRNSKARSGVWRLTKLAHNFLLGKASIPKEVYTYKGTVLDKTGSIDIHSKLEGWKTSSRYAEDAMTIKVYVSRLLDQH